MKSIYKLLFTAVILIVSSGLVSAQETISLEGISGYRSNYSGRVSDNGKTLGTYLFYVKDKVDKNNKEFGIKIFDPNLVELLNFTFEENKYMIVKEVAFSEGNFAVLMYHASTKGIILKMFDSKGKFLKEEKEDFRKMKIYDQFYTITDGSMNQNLFSTSDGGFALHLTYVKGMQLRFLLNYYHPKNAKKWSYEPDVDSKTKSMEIIGEFNQKLYAVVSVSKKEFKLEGIDIKTGRIAHKFLPNSFKNPVIFSNLSPHPVNPDQLIITGAYVDDDKSLLKESTKGLAFITIDSKGKAVEQKYLSWEKELSNYVNVSSKGKVEDIGYMFVHNVVSHDGKNFYAIAEGYNKAFNAAGTAVAIATRGAGGSLTKVNINDIVILHMNEKFEIKKYHVIDQLKESFSIQGGTYANVNLLARVIKAYGYFNYRFSTIDAERDRVQFYISSFLRKDGSKGSYFQVVNMKDGKIDKTDLPYKTEASLTNYYVTEPGKIMILDYFKKDKKINLRIESI